MEKTNELTQKQKGLLSIYKDKWLSIGLETKPADRKMAELGVKEAYKMVNLKEPKIVWCLSPLSAGLTRYSVFKIKNYKAFVGAFVRDSVRDSVEDSAGDSVWDSVRNSAGDSVWNSVGASVRNSVWDSVGDSVRDSVRNSVWDSVGDSVRDSVWNSVGASVKDSVGDSVWDSVGVSVRDSVWNSVGASVGASVKDSVGDSVWNSVRVPVRDSVGVSVWDSVGDSVRDSVRNSVWDSVGNSVRDSGYGQHDASWLGFYDYFNNVLKLGRQTKRLKGLWIIAKSANWFIPHENICWISERHNICKLKNGRIHSEIGPAIQYPDGFSIYGLNGVRVKRKIVETPAEELDPTLLIKEQNTEVRREIMRKIGVSRILQKLKAEKLDSWLEYELYKIEKIDIETVHILKMRCPSTEAFYALRIPPDINKCEKALNWCNFGINKKDFLTET